MAGDDNLIELRQKLVATEAAYIELKHEFEAEQHRRRVLERDLDATKRKAAELQDIVEQGRVSFAKLSENPAQLKFYTGLDANAILFIMDMMGDAIHNACRHTTADTTNFTGLQGGRKRALKPDEPLLFLMKLRHNFPEEDLAHRFGVHQTTV